VAECTKYTNMISGFADGELSDSEKAELQRHLDECPDCMALLSAYRSISEAAEKSMTEPPADFASSVMRRIKALPEDEQAEKFTGPARRNRKSYKPVIISLVAAAACLALVFLVSPQLFGFLGGSRTASSVPDAAPNAAFDVSAAASATPAPGEGGTLQAPAAKQADTGSNTEGTTQDYAIASTPQLTGGAEPSPSGQAQPSAAPSASAPPDIQQPQVVSAESLTDYLKEYYAVITIKGQLPDILTEKAKLDNSDGTFNIEITVDLAEQLIKDGFDVQMGNKDMTAALVVYAPA
jgi:anti-sigma factor RsiW